MKPRSWADDVTAYRRANPWTLMNLQNSQALCGRYPDRESAEQAARERGGVVQVNALQRVVYFSEMPSL